MEGEGELAPAGQKAWGFNRESMGTAEELTTWGKEPTKGRVVKRRAKTQVWH